MSDYTQTDLDTVRNARRKRMSGQTVASVAVNGKRIEFNQMTLQELDQLESQILRSLSQATGGVSTTHEDYTIGITPMSGY